MRAILLMIGLLAAGAPVYAQAWCEGGDVVSARVDGSTVAVHHQGSLYNCCPEGFEYSISLHEQVLDIEEREILVTPCRCTCCYDLEVMVEDVPPGDYLVNFRWFDYETQAWAVESLAITVPPVGQLGPPTIAGSMTSGCLPAGSSLSTWGTIKALYQ